MSEREVATTRSFSRKRRRPSGEPPPLPRKKQSRRFWVTFWLIFAACFFYVVPFGPSGALAEDARAAILRFAARTRTAWLTPPMKWIQWLGSIWFLEALRLATAAILIWSKQWRRLLVFAGSLLVLGGFSLNLPVPRVHDVRSLGTWSGFSNSARPVALLTVTLVGMGFALLPDGKLRHRWFRGAGIAIAVFAYSQLYLALDTPGDVAFAVALGTAIPLLGFWWLCPDDVFPVHYGKGVSAHLDLGGARGQAIVRGVEDQLGLTVEEVKPFGLTGSGASSPMRIRVSGADEDFVFAKLYARSHLRADRWYKLGRTMLYGRLEDERSFRTVKRLVEYEDYMLRVMHDAGLPTADPYGVVVITPGWEYMVVTEFFEGGVELREARVDEAIVDQGLEMVRALWDAGLAHRDVKPSNLLIKDGEMRLIDVAFGELRPSPWREVVDLANMMLVLGLHADPKLVFQRALRLFTEDEIAEAFAATHGVTIPTELRKFVTQDGRDVVAEFRAIVPARSPIAVQRWTIRRLALTAGVAFGLLLALTVAVENLLDSGLF